MSLLHRPLIEERRQAEGPSALRIDPLLDPGQIGEVTIDLRLGYDFLVSVLTRKPYVSLTRGQTEHRDTSSYFQMTRREIGDQFVLYPGQTVLATTLEYIALPADVYADILTRSSYARLGVHCSGMIQPGFRGVFPLEIHNHGNNPLELVVGSRVVQTRLFSVGETTDYQAGAEPRKYLANVRPIVSRASDDEDLGRLSIIRKASGLSK